MKKELLIAAKFDTSDFDKSIEQMQKKLKEIYAPADMIRAQATTAQKVNGVGIGMNGPSQDSYVKATQQSRRELEGLIKEQVQGQEKLGKMIAGRTEKLVQLKQQQKEMVSGSQQELEIKEKIARVEENNFRLKEGYIQRSAAIQGLAEAKKRSSPSDIPGVIDEFKLGGFKHGMSTIPGMLNQNKAGIGIGLASGLTAVGAAAERFSGYERRLEGAQGSAVSGTAGQDINSIFNGNAASDAAWMPERTQASGLAENEAGRNRITDRMKGIGSAGLIAGGLATGVASIAGAPFTMGGSTLGLPAAASMIGAGVYGLSNDRSRKGIFGGEDYEKLLASQQASDFRENLENIKKQNPGKKFAVEDFEKNYQRNADVQRTLGLSNEGFYGEGKFRDKGTRAGFLPEQMMQMGQSIVGAGGSSRMGQEGQFGLQMQRMGMTNSSSLLGTLSGSINSPESSKRAMVSIISEAFNIGLDNSDFAEENRRFAQSASAIIAKAGANTENDQNNITANLGRFVGERTNVGIQSATSAYEQFQERGSQLGGRRGAMRFSSAMQDKNLGRLQTDDLAELLGMRPDQLKENSESAQYFADQAGLSVPDLIKKVQDQNKSSRFQIPGNEDKAKGFSDTINEYMKKNKLSLGQLTEQQDANKLPKEISHALGGLEVAVNKEEGGGLTSQQARARVGEFLDNQSGSSFTKDQVKDKLEKGEGRLEDVWNAKAAEGAGLATKNFREMIPMLNEAAAASSKFVEQFANVAKVLDTSEKERRKSAPMGDPYNQSIIKSMVQPTPKKKEQ